MSSEQSIHQWTADYLKLRYPSTYFRTDFSAGVKMTMGQAIKHKRLQMCRAYPDLFIATCINGYGGLYLELKKEGTTIYKRDGQLVANEHIREQAKVLTDLRQAGYVGYFGIGIDEIKLIIDDYLAGRILAGVKVHSFVYSALAPTQVHQTGEVF